MVAINKRYLKKNKDIYLIMEFIKFGLLAFIFFFFSWIQIISIFASFAFIYYYINNKHLLLDNSNYFNIFIYYFVTLCEISYYYFKVGYQKFKNNSIGKYIHNYLESVNNKYLSLRKYLINKIFNFTMQSAVKIMMTLDKEEKKNELSLKNKNQKNTRPCLKDSFDIDKFLSEIEMK